MRRPPLLFRLFIARFFETPFNAKKTALYTTVTSRSPRIPAVKHLMRLVGFSNNLYTTSIAPFFALVNRYCKNLSAYLQYFFTKKAHATV